MTDQVASIEQRPRRRLPRLSGGVPHAAETFNQATAHG